MADKYSAHGTLLQVDISGTYTTVASTMSIDFPGAEVLYFDADSTDADECVEDGELVGQSTPGEAAAEIFYDPVDPTHNLLARDPAQGGVQRSWKILMPDTDTSVVAWDGSVKNFKPKAAVKDGFKASLSIKCRTLAVYPAAPA